jgi:ribonuclease HII
MSILTEIECSIGVDEAGRGPLAGPVVVAAVCLPKGFDCSGLNDSKQMSPEQREEQAASIKSRAKYAIVEVDPEEIDRLNILWATMAGMERAVAELDLDAPVYIDGNRLPLGLMAAHAVIKGDSKIACIAAASILAKTHRDALMRGYGGTFPGYGFESHFGYPTPEHFAALRELGPCPIHRRSFRPVREAEQPLLFDA